MIIHLVSITVVFHALFEAAVVEPWSESIHPVARFAVSCDGAKEQKVPGLALAAASAIFL